MTTIERDYKKLLDDGRAEEARDMLLARAYTEGLDEEAQRLYLASFPLAVPPEAGLPKLLEAVRTAPPAERAKAARKLNTFARGNWTESRRQWLTDPRVIADLLAALDIADDKTAVDLIGALGASSQRYKFRDLRIRERLVPLFEGASDPIRIAIVQAIPHFGGADVWALVARGIDCRPSKSAHFAVGLAVARYGESASGAAREALARCIEAACSKQTNMDALGALVKGLRVVGDRGSVDALLAVKDRVESRVLKETVDDAIESCRARS